MQQKRFKPQIHSQHHIHTNPHCMNPHPSPNTLSPQPSAPSQTPSPPAHSPNIKQHIPNTTAFINTQYKALHHISGPEAYERYATVQQSTHIKVAKRKSDINPNQSHSLVKPINAPQSKIPLPQTNRRPTPLPTQPSISYHLISRQTSYIPAPIPPPYQPTS